MEHWTDRLSEYLDGELDARERAAAERHLAACATCAASLADLGTIAQQARALTTAPPEVDLWPSIAARLEPRGVPWWQRLRDALAAGRYSFTFPQLAAATAAIVVITGGLVWFALQRPPDQVARVVPAPPPTQGVSGTPIAGSAESEPAQPEPRREQRPQTDPLAQGIPATFDAARYDAAVADLQRVLDEHRSELDTTTVRILEQNLAIIDRATEEARRALLADPANPYLNGHLADQMRRKIRLLQRAAEVVNAHS